MKFIYIHTYIYICGHGLGRGGVFGDYFGLCFAFLNSIVLATDNKCEIEVGKQEEQKGNRQMVYSITLK